MRNDASWSAVKPILSFAAAFMLLVGTAQAQWTLIDDFEGLSAGDTVSGSTGSGAAWDGGALHTAQADPSDAGNLSLQVLGTAGNSVLRGQFSDASTNIAAGTTGTLYYRFRTPDASLGGTTDHVVGLTDNADVTNFGFKAGLRNTTGSTPNPNDPRTPLPANNMDVRNGGGYEHVSFLADSTWYRLWMVAANTDPGMHEVFLQSDTDTNFAAQTKLSTATPADVFDFRVNGATDIVNVYFRGAGNANGTADSNLYFDDVWINSSARDLSVPSAVPEPTGVVLLLTGLGMLLTRRRR